MMRSLWTAATGMIAQQTNLDTISNNLSNINTTGYKKETTEFKTLLYQTIQENTTDNEGNPKPVTAQVGLGVRNSAVTSHFTQGIMQETGGAWDFAIQGSGFFAVRLQDGRTAYTRNGSLNMGVGTNGNVLCTSDGNPILDTNGNAIVIDKAFSPDKLTVDETGNLCYLDEKNNAQPIGIQIGLVQFNNPSGLEKMSSSLLLESAASGAPKMEVSGETYSISTLKNKFLEGSNVQAVDEMVNMIVAQRAYEMNSKAITASDEMLQQANNLRS